MLDTYVAKALGENTSTTASTTGSTNNGGYNNNNNGGYGNNNNQGDPRLQIAYKFTHSFFSS